MVSHLVDAGRPAGPTWDGVLVRFGELGIKSAPVRRRMLERLRANLLDAMEREGVEGDVRKVGARLWMAGPDAARLAALAQRAFGVVSVSPARLVPADLAGLCREAVVLALSRPWASFAIRPTREGTHPFTSHDVAVEAGQAVLDAARKAGRAARVDLDRPDLELGVDVRGERAYLFLERLPGSGGLPVGSQGTALCLLSDEASFVAAWLMMRRGCAVVTLHAGDTGSVPVEAVEALGRWGLPRDIEVLPVCTGTVTKANLLEAAARVAAERGAIALVTGETLDAMPLAVPAAPMPVLRPVCGLDPEEYARLRNRIGLPAIEAKKVLDPRGRDTVESMLRLRRRVSA